MLRPTVQSASPSWNKAPIWGLKPDIYYSLAAFPLVQLRMQCDTCIGCMRRGNSMQEERHAQNGCARGRRQVTHVSRSQTGRYVPVFASLRLLVHVSV
jgi:hypothetical protein